MTQSELDALLAKGIVRLKATGGSTRPRTTDADACEAQGAIPDVDVRANPSAAEIKESELQAQCEAWLRSRRYQARTPKNIQGGTTGKWYIHINKAKQNPIVLDFVLLNSVTGRYCEIELKVQGGALSPDQKALIIRKEGVVVWSLEQFKQAVDLWELVPNNALHVQSGREAGGL